MGGNALEHKLDVEERNILQVMCGRAVAAQKENFKGVLKMSRLLRVIDSDLLDDELESRRVIAQKKTDDWVAGGRRGAQPSLSDEEIRGESRKYEFPVGLNSFCLDALKSGQFVGTNPATGESYLLNVKACADLLDEFGLELDDSTFETPKPPAEEKK
jgi:hypothetical protein